MARRGTRRWLAEWVWWLTLSVSRTRGGAQSAAAYRLVTLAISTGTASTSSHYNASSTTKFKKKLRDPFIHIVLRRLLTVSFKLKSRLLGGPTHLKGFSSNHWSRLIRLCTNLTKYYSQYYTLVRYYIKELLNLLLSQQIKEVMIIIITVQGPQHKGPALNTKTNDFPPQSQIKRSWPSESCFSYTVKTNELIPTEQIALDIH